MFGAEQNHPKQLVIEGEASKHVVGHRKTIKKWIHIVVLVVVLYLDTLFRGRLYIQQKKLSARLSFKHPYQKRILFPSNPGKGMNWVSGRGLRLQ